MYCCWLLYCDPLRSLLKWRRVYYIYGPVQRYLLDLEGLDAPYSTHRPHGSISSSARPLVAASSSSSIISDGLPSLRRAVAACCSWLAGRRRQRPARQQQQHEGVILPPRLQQAERSKSGDSLRAGRRRQPTAMSPAALAGEQQQGDEDDETALQLVCRHRHLRLIMLPAVRDYVRDKWHHWGRGVLGRRMAVGYTTYNRYKHSYSTTGGGMAVAYILYALYTYASR